MRAHFDIEAPRRFRLMRDMKYLSGDICGHSILIVWTPFTHPLPHPPDVDQRVDGDVGDMQALRVQVTGQRLGFDGVQQSGICGPCDEVTFTSTVGANNAKSGEIT